MNEIERRLIEITQNTVDLNKIVKAMGKSVTVEYFGYALQIGGPGGGALPPILNGVTQQGIITIRADAFFLVEYISACVVLPVGSTFGDVSLMTGTGNINLQITDTGAGQELFNVAAPAGILAGFSTINSAGVPLVFPTPRLIPPNTNIKVEITQLGQTGLSNPAPLAFYIMLNGTRIALV